MGRMTPEKAALGLTANQTNPGNPEDSDKFQETVYRSGGNFRCKGRKWTCKGVGSQDELEQALKDGWSKTLDEALNELPTEADTIKSEITKIKAEKELEAAKKELAELRKWKADREAAANGEAAKPIETATTSEFTAEELYALYIDNGKDYKKVTELTGVKSPHLKIQPYAKSKGLEV